jgi:hypothetical protein
MRFNARQRHLPCISNARRYGRGFYTKIQPKFLRILPLPLRDHRLGLQFSSFLVGKTLRNFRPDYFLSCIISSFSGNKKTLLAAESTLGQEFHKWAVRKEIGDVIEVGLLYFLFKPRRFVVFSTSSTVEPTIVYLGRAIFAGRTLARRNVSRQAFLFFCFWLTGEFYNSYKLYGISTGGIDTRRFSSHSVQI